MISVIASCEVKAGCEQRFEQIAQVMVAETHKEPNYVHYEFGKVVGTERTYAFVEMWHSQADQEAHFTLPHIQNALPELSELLANELDIKVIEMK